MNREWKPGNVALVNDCTRPEAPWKPATCKEAARPGQMETVWILHDSGAKVWGSVSDARPLVVIDPEDREAVERLILALPDAADWGFASADNYDNPDDLTVVNGIVEPFQAALREYAKPTPPKPDEPQGLGAVVEDAKGVLWIRADGDRLPWLNSESSGDYWLSYADISVVRILSPGVEVSA